MRILVLSDSHSDLRFMRQSAAAVHLDVILHLGDYYDDGEVIREEFPNARFFQVPGNCDEYRAPVSAPPILMRKLDGVQIYMTHGHLHHVKQGIGALLRDGRAAGAQLVLYGHTHREFCEQMEDGLWVLNPGTCGEGIRTAGIVEIEQHRIRSCRIISADDLAHI